MKYTILSIALVLAACSKTLPAPTPVVPTSLTPTEELYRAEHQGRPPPANLPPNLGR